MVVYFLIAGFFFKELLPLYGQCAEVVRCKKWSFLIEIWLFGYYIIPGHATILSALVGGLETSGSPAAPPLGSFLITQQAKLVCRISQPN